MPNSENEAVTYLKNRFGVKVNELEGLELVKRHGDLWLAAKSESKYESETRGIRAIRDTGIGLKPTTYLLQYLNEEISKSTVELNEEEFRKLLGREEMIPADLNEEGYVALKYENRVIGCGFYKNEKVSSRIPKGRSQELLKALF